MCVLGTCSRVYLKMSSLTCPFWHPNRGDCGVKKLALAPLLLTAGHVACFLLQEGQKAKDIDAILGNITKLEVDEKNKVRDR